MELLTQTHLKSLRDSLEFQLRDLRATLHAAEQAQRVGQPAAEHEVVDQKDLAAQRESASIDDEEERRARDELELVEAALQRLQAGSYGDCPDCGEPIALARLQVQPAALRCVSCQGVWEQAQNRVEPHRRT